jgi:hypothetical protein
MNKESHLKLVIAFSLVIMSSAIFAESGSCLLQQNSTSSDGSVDYSFTKSYTTKTSIEKCMKEAGKMIDESRELNAQIIMKHSLLGKKVTILIEDK